MRISDWSSDVCSSDLSVNVESPASWASSPEPVSRRRNASVALKRPDRPREVLPVTSSGEYITVMPLRSEEHTSELQSLMRISYAVFCLKQKKKADVVETGQTEAVGHEERKRTRSHTIQ